MLWKIITNEEDFEEVSKDWEGPVACDTETFGKRPEEGRLLGISFSGNRGISIYIPFWEHQEDGSWTFRAQNSLVSRLKTWFRNASLIGHNFTYDKKWLASKGFKTHWAVDTRIMWHLASAPSGPRPYGLKNAQVELLGWSNRGDEELKLHVEAKGGSLSKGDHYLADTEILAKYACLDTHATYEIYRKLKGWFEAHSYWGLLRDIMAYNELLEENTTRGIGVDLEGLQKAHNRLIQAKEAAMKRLAKDLKEPLESLQKDWLDRKLATYKREYNRIRLLNHPEEHPKFNWNSDKHKRELFYDKLGNEVVYTTDSGQPSTNADSVKQMKGEWVESYLKYEKANTLSTNFSGPYIGSIVSGRIHPGFNICGTVSYRLSGFKPYFLNAPFDEKHIMKHFKCSPGFVGLHADLAAIEPTMTAHFSDDPALLKVFRDGLGDIYLDLALSLFPDDQRLRSIYDPNAPITKAVKKELDKQRKIAKVIQLAVQYTGTKYTVSKNLKKEGIDADIWEADRYVQAYWRKFHKVAEFNNRLRELNRAQGYLRNVIGRIIRVPDPEYKDLPNRFIQSSAHDCLVLWVLEIDRLRKERGVEMYPVLVDIHDSTSWEVREDQVGKGEEIFKDALETINRRLELSVTIKAEMKKFLTLAGLKGEE